MPAPSRSLSIVVPCYCDRDQIQVLFDELGPLLAEYPDGELVLVDDGSPDGTGDRIEELAPTFDGSLTFVRLARNFGQHPAVFAGLEAARGDVVVTTDSDLQYPPAAIRELVDLVSAEQPVVSGYREDRKDPVQRRIITRLLTTWLGRRTGQELRDYGSMFRAYDREVVDAMVALTERHRYVPAIPSWLGYRVLEVPVQHRARGEQGSRYRLSSLVQLFLDLLTSYSVAPLRFVSLLGVIGAVTGFMAMLAFIFYRLAVGDGISGTVTAFALIFALLAIQLGMTAMLGEYVGRVYVETRQRPYYIVRSTRHYSHRTD